MAHDELQMLETKFENLQKNSSNIKFLHQEEKELNGNVSVAATIII